MRAGEFSSDAAHKSRIVDIIRDLMDEFYGKYRFGIVTALEKEAAAVQRSVDELEIITHPNQQLYYWHGTYPGSKEHSNHSVVLVLTSGTGNSASAATTSAMLRDFPKISDVLMVGIAGGIPNLSSSEKDVRLGDIVVSAGAGLVQYDLVKIEDDEIEVRSQAPKPSARLSGAVRALEVERLAGRNRCDKHIDRCAMIEHGLRPPPETDKMTPLRQYGEDKDPRRRVDLPTVHHGIIASASALLKNAKMRDELKEKFGVIAAEMEGSGIADGAWLAGCDYLIVRGICDYCDSDKDDRWQGYAAAVAAAYTRSLFEVIAS
jgi:nucleoside phosphorylase